MASNRFILDRKFADLIESFNISIQEVLKRATLPEDLFSHKSPSVTASQYIKFMDILKELSNDTCIPIKIATVENIEAFSPPIFAAYCSKNILICIERIATYKKLVGPVLFLVNENSDSIVLEIISEDEKVKLPEFLVATEMAFLVQLFRNATKTHIIPMEITTQYRIDNDDYEKFFGIRPKVGERNILTISREDAMRPFISQNDIMWEYFEPELRKRLSELEIDDTYAARVRSALIELLPAGMASIDDVASKLGYSQRTLQRKLKEEDTTFQKQLGHTRELLARHYLSNTSVSSDEIAYLLGYQDLNSFVRAFHIWTGVTISEYKKSIGN